MSDRQHWESRYADAAAVGTRAPSSFLVAQRHRLPHGRALDLACGDGRNALDLARHGWRVDAIDFAHGGLARLLAAARREELALDALVADLEQFPLPTDLYDVVINCRYLQRSLCRAITASLRSGGVVVFETFIRDQAALGHPRNPAFLLERGEVSSLFGALEILEHEEGRFETESGSAFLARLVARKP
jgi:tellurite methyltransferase